MIEHIIVYAVFASALTYVIYYIKKYLQNGEKDAKCSGCAIMKLKEKTFLKIINSRRPI